MPKSKRQVKRDSKMVAKSLDDMYIMKINKRGSTKINDFISFKPAR